MAGEGRELAQCGHESLSDKVSLLQRPEGNEGVSAGFGG